MPTRELYSSAQSYVPSARSLPILSVEIQNCHGCDLYLHATQAVFGEVETGTKTLRTKVTIMMIGEQPGDKEDLEGRPFVGPSGKLLAHCLEEAGIDRQKVYVINVVKVVKHFKWEPRGEAPYSQETKHERDSCLSALAGSRTGNGLPTTNRLPRRSGRPFFPGPQVQTHNRSRKTSGG